jgi:hypothetical protein
LSHGGGSIADAVLLPVALGVAQAAQAPDPAGTPWPAGWPVYDLLVIVVEVNKHYRQILNTPDAPHIS